MNCVVDDMIAEDDEQKLRLMSNAKVMMIDDEPLIMSVLQVHLTAQGYERFVSLSDSTTAMDVLRKENPSVLLLDLNMPEVSGLDILRQVRLDPELLQLPVIVLTSSSEPDAKLKALALGATDFLSKPVDASELALRMRNTLVSRAYQQQLKHFDPLTNLPNRQYLSDKVHTLVARPNTNKNHIQLILINLCRFKSINATYGSSRGDDILWAFSQRIQKVFGMEFNHQTGLGYEDNDQLCIVRLGGDRFGILLKSPVKSSDDIDLDGRLIHLHRKLEEPFIIDSKNVYVNVSIGVSTLDASVNSTETLINHADAAMNVAQKKQSKSHVYYSVDMLAGVKRRLSIENALRTAIADETLTLLYQPKVDIKSDEISGAEALLRLNHPELGPISPVEFIPVAEASGLIVSLGQWVLESACAEAASFVDLGYVQFKMAVNVSIRQFHDSQYIPSVEAILNKTGLQAQSLIIELTENMIMENADGNIDKLASLQKLGLQISVDDFGTGYSSLSYLQRFPIDQLKIDRSFVTEIDNSSSNYPIVKAVVSLAQDLQLSVVAEGVETLEQLDYLRKINCTEYQGYLMSRAVPAAELLELMVGEKSRIA